jgi:hypothetical protein
MLLRQHVFPAALARVALVGFVVMSSLSVARAEPAVMAAEIEGQEDALQLRATNASIKQVFEALSSRFHLTYKLPPTVVRELTGTYSGTLAQVLARVLDGNDYVAIFSDGGLDLVVLGESGTLKPSGIAIARAAAVSGEASGRPSPQPGPGPAPAPAPARLSAPAPQPSLPQGNVVPPLSSYLSADAAAGVP